VKEYVLMVGAPVEIAGNVTVIEPVPSNNGNVEPFCVAEIVNVVVLIIDLM
jgi:hypothetical protein